MNDRGRRWAVIGVVAGVVMGGVMFRSNAHARSAPTQVAVLPVEIEGELDPEIRSQINERVTQELENEAYLLVPYSPPGGRCADHRCIHEAAGSANARYVVVPAVGTTSHDYGIAVRLYDFSGQLAVTKESTCEICSHEEVVSAIGAQAQQLVEPLVRLVEKPYGDRGQESREDTGPAELWLQTLPSGASVRVDGNLVGKTPLRLEVEPGLRNLEVSLRGYLPHKQTIRTVRGSTAELRLDLAESQDNQNRAMKISAIVLAAAGIPALAAGITLLVLDERPYKPTCSLNNLDYEGNCRYQYDTLTSGAVLTSLGLAGGITAATLGLVLYGRNRQARAAARDDDFATFPVRIRPLVGFRSAGLQVSF